MINKKFVFVVLHYKTVIQTEECVDSLLKFKQQIIIVCNKCRINDGLFEKYTGNKLIEIIYNEENLGFARGINSGFVIAKKKYKADFIICVNNDVIIEQSNFINVIEEEYDCKNFGVAGPDIINLNGIHQNPRFCEIPTVESVTRNINELHKRIKGCDFLGGLPEILHCILKKVPSAHAKKNDFMNLHGACLIFTSLYISQFDGICDKTFLYGEEEILALNCYIRNIPIKYIEGIQILHKEAASTKTEFHGLIRRHKFFYENLLNSRLVLLELLKKEE